MIMEKTNYKDILGLSFSRIQFQTIQSSAIENPETFQTIFKLMFDKNEKVAWRAAWICEKISEKHPSFFTSQSIFQIIELATTTTYSGVLRLTLSTLLNLSLPENLPVEFINLCFDRMVSLRQTVAVQVLSMKILYEFTKQEPDFRTELKNILESIEPEEYTVGYKTARRNILKRLAKSE